MATSFLGRTLISKPTFASLLSRSFTSSPLARVPSVYHRLHFLIAAKEYYQPPAVTGVCYFSTRPTTSSLNDPSPNWSNRPPKETILLDGCDFEHWLVVMEPPDENATRDDIIDSYIKTLAQVVGSEEEARKKIYSVSSRCYFAFGCLRVRGTLIQDQGVSDYAAELPKVRWVLPDSYLDVKNKDYGGEPFIDGKAVPYDPKYHEEWIRNNARANERSRRNDRPQNFDRSRNFERRRENMQNRDMNMASHPVINNAQTSPNPGTGSTGTAPYQNQGSVPTGGMTNPGYQNQGQGGMPSGGYRNQNRVAMPNSGFQNQGYRSPGMGGEQNIPGSGRCSTCKPWISESRRGWCSTCKPWISESRSGWCSTCKPWISESGSGRCSTYEPWISESGSERGSTSKPRISEPGDGRWLAKPRRCWYADFWLSWSFLKSRSSELSEARHEWNARPFLHGKRYSRQR